MVGWIQRMMMMIMMEKKEECVYHSLQLCHSDSQQNPNRDLECGADVGDVRWSNHETMKSTWKFISSHGSTAAHRHRHKGSISILTRGREACWEVVGCGNRLRSRGARSRRRQRGDGGRPQRRPPGGPYATVEKPGSWDHGRKITSRNEEQNAVIATW